MSSGIGPVMLGEVAYSTDNRAEPFFITHSGTLSLTNSAGTFTRNTMPPL
jgi:hypothetical protein